MRDRLANLVQKAVKEAKLKPPEIIIEIPREKRFGDFATNVAILLAKETSKSPSEVAEAIAQKLPRLDKEKILAKAEVAPPGFINLFVNDEYLQNNLLEIKKLDERYGQSSIYKGKRILIEFVSANPTGPLHVGHGRWAVIGDIIGNLLAAVGYKVEIEYYVNDVGTQVDLLIQSVRAAIENREIPEGGYGGEYVRRLSEDQNIRARISENQSIREIVLKMILDEQKETLENLGVKFEHWFFESDLHKGRKISEAVDKLRKAKMTEELEGALWFKSKEFGDEKNRVLIREKGEPTYFAADIAYHLNKFNRGYNRLINVWGTDHHGYVPRMKAVIKALGLPADNLEIIIGQLVALYRGKELIRMSKRTGEMITLKEVINEIGKDATRFFLAMVSPNTRLDFDLELAKEKSANNPVYYVQYAHARICSIFREGGRRREKVKINGANLKLLTHPEERELMRKLADFPDEVTSAAKAREPQRLTTYAQSLATTFHSFYQKHRVLSEEAELTKARLLLVNATRIVLRNVLKLLGISPKEEM